MPWPDETMINLELLTLQIKRMVARWFPFASGTKSVCELLAVIGEDDVDPEGSLSDRNPSRDD